MQCFPLWSVLLALDNPTIDYFSLDVEGSEVFILQSLPWSRIDVRVWTIEHNGIAKAAAQIDDVMIANGYVKVKEIARDFVYIRSDVLRQFEGRL